MWTGAQAQPDGDNPPITVAGSDDKTGAPVHVDTVALVRASVNAARNRQAIPSQTDPSIIELRDSVAEVGDCDYEQNVRKLCQVGEDDGDKTLVLIGDSHARAWIPPSTASTRPATGRPTTSSSRSAPRPTSRSPRPSPTTRCSPTARTSRTG